MPHGTPDWGLLGPKTTVFGLDDLGEHAARLGSPHFFDRRGDTVFLTDFSEGMSFFWPVAWGGAGTTGFSTGNSRTGAYAVRLTPGATAGDYAELQFMLAPSVLGPIGLEFTFGSAEVGCYWEGWLHWNDGVDWAEARIRVSMSTGELEYYIGAARWVHIATVGTMRAWASAMHTLKMVVDINREEYVRVLLNDQVYPLPGVPIPPVGGVLAPHIRGHIRCTRLGAIMDDGYVDNVIITQNEP